MKEATGRKKVPLLDLGEQHKQIRAEIDTAVKRVFDSQQYILGPEVKALEEELATYCQSSYAVGCASGSDALLLALMAYDIKPGDEVITTPYTFFATIGAIVRLGAKPVLVDIEPDTFNLEISQVEAVITENTRAIIPIHLFGQCAEMDELNEIGKKHGVKIIEDAAQAIGSKYKGKLAGNLADLGCFSFYPSKNLGGVGDGGMLTTSDNDTYQKLKALRAHGAKVKYFHDYVGINSRLDALQAAILRVKLKYLDGWAEGRIRNANFYREAFRENGLVDSGAVKLPVEKEDCHHIYNQFVIRVKSRDALRKYLSENGVGTEIYYPLALHLQPCFKFLGYQEGSFPESEKASQESLAIPIYPELTKQDQGYVVETIKGFYN
ncbi:MAG: DegT/DnrJ/EryC1/StrS family aminotransferase [Acidobacteriota bacterium]